MLLVDVYLSALYDKNEVQQLNQYLVNKAV